MSGFFAISIISILLLFISVDCSDPPSSSSSCTASSCGNITNISFPFRLKSDPISCGYGYPDFVLDCQNNVTALSLQSGRYYVQAINYDNYTIRVVDPGLFNHCPTNSLNPQHEWRWAEYYRFRIATAAFVHCLSEVNSSIYRKDDFCGNKSITVSEFYSYMVIGEGSLQVSDVEESCVVDKLTGISYFEVRDNSTFERVYYNLSYGFELPWYRVHCDKCNLRYQNCGLDWYNKITCTQRFSTAAIVAYSICGAFVIIALAIYGPPVAVFLALVVVVPFTIGASLLIVGVILALKFLIGFPLVVRLVVRKWRRRHLSTDKTIEEFLRAQNNLTPIKYSYSEISKMTDNFNQKLGEGRYGIVYRGKLRSGPLVAVKMMAQSRTYEEEFINELGTIGRIHHANVVQLVGYCVEGSKCALVYEFLPNGSLDRYIFNLQSLPIALTYEKMFEIALGIARGIAYLHHGCEMRILHFDIKPHNVLLDENFCPKISDFGLAKLYATNDSVIILTDVRGTMGYMAPEMFYKNIGGVSYKADIYSFGMLLMEMIGKRKNMKPFSEHMSQIYFPSWVYDQLKEGNEIQFNDAATEEKRMINKIILVGLWCIQMKPCDRPPMIKAVEMLEGDSEVAMPPKPFLAPHESPRGDHISQTYTVDCVNLEVPDN